MERITVNGVGIAYRDEGTGPAVLLVHGWPTSSYLWREQIPAIAKRNRVIALDLPGFGESDKPLDLRYGFSTFEGVIDQLLAALGVDRVAVGGHDLGGPIAMHWALRHQDRVTGVAMLNTLLYPELDASTMDFVRRLSTPGEREKLTSTEGLGGLFRLGLATPAKATDDIVAAVVAPFQDAQSRQALALAGIQLSLRGFGEIAASLPALGCPLRIVYGEQDRLLPDVAETMARVQRDVPHAVVTALPHCGHFLQEDAPEEVGELLADFFDSLDG
jgi:pimeloyl-ACP methyl ester carboxylesterase